MQASRPAGKQAGKQEASIKASKASEQVSRQESSQAQKHLEGIQSEPCLFHSPGWPVKGVMTTSLTSDPGRGSATTLSAHLAWSCPVSCSTTGPAHFKDISDYFLSKPRTDTRTPQDFVKTSDLLLVTPSRLSNLVTHPIFYPT